MSNSRLMLTCRYCGEQMVLGKGYFGKYFTACPDIKGYELNEFFEAHAQGKCVSWRSPSRFIDFATEHFCVLEEGEDVKPYLHKQLNESEED